MARVRLLALVLLVTSALPAVAQSRKGELRGVWMGSGYDRDWPAVMKSLKDNGFNAIFPNMCTGGVAFYPSKVLPVAPGAKPGRDELAEAVKAAKQYGLELHVWRINWMLEGAPPEVLKRYEAEGRLMRKADGKLARDDADNDLKTDWLCPSQPANRKLEKEAMLELVRRYDLAGVQFDYLRFPGPDYCYCDHCKAQFEKDTGVKLEKWPDDARGDGKYAKQYESWRQGLETSLVKDVSEEIHRAKPGVFVSLAAWPEVGVAQHEVLQDWPTWVKQGSLDFICFMNYGTEADYISGLVKSQVDLVGGAIPIYSGLGAFMLKRPEDLSAQIRASREAGADGFVAFAYGTGDLAQWLPALHADVTAQDPAPMPHWGPPTLLRLTGPAVIAPESDRRVKAGAQLSLDLKLGLPPGEPSAVADEGAQQAADILRQASDYRQPVDTYGGAPGGSGVADDTYRLSGRIVAETPSGDPRAVLAAFSADWQYVKQLSFPAPTGPFRVAIYGTEQAQDKQRDFVVRSVLLTGVAEAAPAPTPTPTSAAPGADMHRQLAAAMAGFLKAVTADDVAGLNTTVMVHLTGEGGGDWWVRASGGSCQSGEGAVAAPELTITTSAADALAVSRGEADPYALWHSGRLTASGDVMLLRRLIALLWRTRGS